MTYRFAGFTANTDTRQLLAGEREIHLSPKAFELLRLLIEHRSRAVSKLDIQERLWPSTFVGETNLPALVAEIRRALVDSPQHSAYVRTVHRFGYRFVADVEEVTRAATERPPRMYLTGVDQRFPLAEGEIVIGRGSDAAVRIDSNGVSRHHARIVVKGDEARLEDLGSKNGTFVDGKRVTGTRTLREGDEIRVGNVALTFRMAAPTRATETMG